MNPGINHVTTSAELKQLSTHLLHTFLCHQFTVKFIITGPQ